MEVIRDYASAHEVEEAAVPGFIQTLCRAFQLTSTLSLEFTLSPEPLSYL